MPKDFSLPDQPQTFSLETFALKFKTSLDELCRDARVPRSMHYKKTQNYLKEQIRCAGLEPKTHDFWHLPKGRCQNIYAETGPADAPRLLVGAHYDSIQKSGEGADDNASAVAIVLELMKEPPRDKAVTFAFFDVEENYGFGALKGSKAFCRDYSRPIEEVVILDLVGGTFAPGFEPTFFQFGNSRPQWSHPHLEFLHLPTMFLEPVGKCGARSDYDAFRRQGVAFTFVSSGTPWYYHTPNDSRDRLDLQKMAALYDVLKKSLNTPSILTSASWRRLPDLMKKFQSHEALNLEIVKKLMKSEGTPPSRLALVQLHVQILRAVRQQGLAIWS